MMDTKKRVKKKKNLNSKQYWSFFNHSIDENKIHYYGKNETKQLIRGKPVRFGFKLSSDGYLIHAEP